MNMADLAHEASSLAFGVYFDISSHNCLFDTKMSQQQQADVRFRIWQEVCFRGT